MWSLSSIINISIIDNKHKTKGITYICWKVGESFALHLHGRKLNLEWEKMYGISLSSVNCYVALIKLYVVHSFPWKFQGLKAFVYVRKAQCHILLATVMTSDCSCKIKLCGTCTRCPRCECNHDGRSIEDKICRKRGRSMRDNCPDESVTKKKEISHHLQEYYAKEKQIFRLRI